VCEHVFVSDVEPGILHADLDAFFASVEQRDDPTLRGRPVLVGGGVIVAASYEAKRCGVRTPTHERDARSLCPNAIVVPPRFDAYLDASRAVFACFDDVTPLVEGISIDEAFLDVRGARRLLGAPLAIAQRLRARVREDVGLPLSIGIASTKFLAKVASASAKPDGVLLVEAGGEFDFLHPLPIERLWGVGPKTSEKLHALGISTVGQLARVPQAALATTIGNAAAAHLLAIASNVDPRGIARRLRRRSIGSQSALGRPRRDLAEMELVVLGIVDRVARRLRADDRLARTLTLRVRFADSQRITRAASFDVATNATAEIGARARALLRENAALLGERGVTLLGLAVSNLVPVDPMQLVLPFPRPGSPPAGRDHAKLDSALDDLHARFGTGSVVRASLLRGARLRESFGQPLYE
jgi:DNA polymerase-4